MERGDAACVTDASQPESAVKEDLDYFAQFADTYLLSEGNLAADLQDIDGGLGDPKPSQTEEQPGLRKVDDGLLRFTWEGSSPAGPALRNSSEPSWNAQGNKSAADLMDTLATEKARADDSSEWEQTREHLSSLPMMKHTDSPESVLMGGGTGPSGSAPLEERPHGLGPASAAGGGGGTGFGPRDPFIRGDRSGSGNAGLESMQMPSSHTGQQQFGRLSDFPGLDHESLADMPTGDMWEPQRGGFPNVPVDSAFRHHGRQDSFWADPADMAGGSDTGFMLGRASGSDRLPIYRMHSDITGAPLRDSRYPARRQYSADLAYDLLPRGGSVDGLGAPGPSGLDPVFEQHISMPQMDGFGGMRLGGGSMPMGAPGARGQSFYGGGSSGQVPMPETPLLDSSRKRMREHYYPSSEHGMAQHERIPAGLRATPRQMRREKLSQEEHLINTLKQQIAALDPQTKATLKDSLYRISRNTNARVNGMGEPPQQRMSSRNSFVDRVVANLMYNRFEPAAPAALRTTGSLGGGGRPSSLGSPYGSNMPPAGPRMGGSSNLPMDAKPPMRLENSPTA